MTIRTRSRWGRVGEDSMWMMGMLAGAAAACTFAAVPVREQPQPTPAAPQETAPPARREQVEQLVAPLIKAKIVPGMVVGLYEKGRTEYFAFGTLSESDARQPDERTLFEIGSITKVFTAMLLADAAEAGAVRLDDALEKWLPKGVKAPERNGKKITLEQLSMHVSGLPRLPTNLKSVADEDPYAPYRPADLWEFLNGYVLTRDPGAMYEYSNLGAGLLGQVLADRAGISYASLVADRITTPLGMSDTVLTLTAEQQARLAPPHREGAAAHSWTFDALAGAGAIRSTASDLMKLVNVTLHPAAAPFTKVVERVLTKHPVSGGPVPMMGLGWHYARDTQTVLHTGQTGGYSSAIFLAPSIDAAVVVLANGADSNVDATAEKLIQMLYGMKVKPSEFAQPITIDEAQAALVAGTYVFGAGPTLTVTHEDNRVYAKLTGQDAYRVYPSSPTRFFYRITPAELEFVEADAQGKPGKVILHQNGGHLPFVRKP